MVRLFYRDSLWSLVAGPMIWATHFLFSYIAAAIYCAKIGGEGGLDALRIVIATLTVLALAGIARAGVQAVDDWRHAVNAEWAADTDTLEMRRHFVGRVAFLLSGLSAIAVIYVGMTVLFVSDCR